MFCDRCHQESAFVHKGFCLNCLWLILTPSNVTMFRTCANCRITKPVDLFKKGDSTCILCRKLISLGIRYSSRLALSKETIFDGNYANCCSCHKQQPSSLMPDNSYECSSCEFLRSRGEVVKVGGMFDDYMNCRGCNVPMLISGFPLGRLKCRGCINKLNSRNSR